MSKLDYVTISIVVVCIAAIIFLVVKTSSLMNGADPGIAPNSVEETLRNNQQEEEDVTPFNGEGGEAQSDYASQAGTGSIDDPDDNEVKPFDPTGAEPFGDEASQATAEKDPPKTNVAPPKRERTNAPARATTSGGRYMVVAGSFRYKANAEEMVNTLKKMGYDSADVGYTNNGTYAVALVDRFEDVQLARDLVNTLKVKHKIDAIVKIQD